MSGIRRKFLRRRAQIDGVPPAFYLDSFRAKVRANYERSLKKMRANFAENDINVVGEEISSTGANEGGRED